MEVTLQQKKGALVVQSNQLVSGRFNMTLLERRIFIKMVSMIKPTDKDFQDIVIEVKEIIQDINLQGNSLYLELKKATKRLLQHVCELEEQDKIIQVSLISSAIYYKGKASIQLRFDPALKPYLLELKKNFTVYGLQQALRLKSYYSLRIFELLKQYAGIGYRLMSIEELKFTLGIEKEYTKYADFKKRVILMAKKELENTDVKFEFRERKSGKKVVAIEFFFAKNTDSLAEIEHLSEERKKIYQDLLKAGLSEAQAKEILSTNLPENVIYKTLYEITLASLDGSIKNKSAYTYHVLKSKAGLK